MLLVQFSLDFTVHGSLFTDCKINATILSNYMVFIPFGGRIG